MSPDPPQRMRAVHLRGCDAAMLDAIRLPTSADAMLLPSSMDSMLLPSSADAILLPAVSAQGGRKLEPAVHDERRAPGRLLYGLVPAYGEG